MKSYEASKMRDGKDPQIWKYMHSEADEHMNI